MKISKKPHDSSGAVEPSLQAETKEDAGKPFVLVYCYIFVVEDGVAYDDGCADKVAGGEVIDKGGTFVEYHVETQSVVAFLILIQYEFIVFVNHDGG